MSKRKRIRSLDIFRIMGYSNLAFQKYQRKSNPCSLPVALAYEKASAKPSVGVWPPPGGRRVFHTQDIDIASVICAYGTFLHGKTGQPEIRNAAKAHARRQLRIENHGFHVVSTRPCAPSRLPLHASLQLSLSVMAGRTTSPVMTARDSMGHAHRDLV